MKPPSVYPTVSAYRWLWGSSPGGLLQVHTSFLLIPALVALAIGLVDYVDADLKVLS
jgi:hypothetical protein